jgi:hypothetical protein
MPLIPALGRQRQEDFSWSLGYIRRPYSKKQRWGEEGKERGRIHFNVFYLT